jgi:hypothetical protein
MIILNATRKRGEKATAVEKLHASGNEVGVGKESCERPKALQVRAVTCHLNDAEKRQASKQVSKRAVEENEWSVSERSRCRGKAAAPNDVIILSNSSSSPSCIVKFDVTEE